MAGEVNITIRQMKPEDGLEVAALAAASPDNGLVTFRLDYQVDAWSAMEAQYERRVGVVAIKNGTRVVGAADVSFGECMYEAGLFPYAHFAHLVVHPGFRRLGIASRLCAWLMEHAPKELDPHHMGKDPHHMGVESKFIAYGYIQKGNRGSQGAVRKVFPDFTGPITAVPFKTLSKEPRPVPGLDVRKVDSERLAGVVEGLNKFAENHNFFQPQTGETLTAWCEKTLFGEPFRHYYVAMDSQNNIVAGMGVTEMYRLRVLTVVKMPSLMRVLNRVLRLVPPEGVLRELVVDKVWFAPGAEEAARYLWDRVRWEWSDGANVVDVFMDPAGPLIEVFRIRPWTIKADLDVVLHAPRQSTRILCPMPD
ncbi:MAG: GNAT family N-acetyltransferase [bacterium]|nr:GNAT family N-acetyltransferase [bacterium]